MWVAGIIYTIYGRKKKYMPECGRQAYIVQMEEVWRF